MNPNVDKLEYKLVPDPDDPEQWFIEVAGAQIKISEVAIEINEEDDTLHYNFKHEQKGGRPINVQIIRQIVGQVLVEMAEYDQGRREFLAEKK